LRMVSSSGYIHQPYDAPGYSVARCNPTLYGVGRYTKAQQVADVMVHERVGRRFGSRMVRYNPELSPPHFSVPNIPIAERFPLVAVVESS
jgi:hypothetical protein